MADNQAPGTNDAQFVFPKSISCPVCAHTFKTLMMKTGKARMVGSDRDLRTRYEGIEPLKYDVVVCPKCGYASLEKTFRTITSVQKQYFTDNFKKEIEPDPGASMYTFKEALDRYCEALRCSIAKQGNDSEKAYLCLKAGWLVRSWHEQLDDSVSEHAALKDKLREKEDDFLHAALDGFNQATMREEYPMCGMDSGTVDYLMAALSARFGKYENCIKILSGIIASPVAGSRIKERCRDLKDEVSMQMNSAEG